MDLTDDRQRKLLFTGIVIALVALGLWLVWPRPDTTPRDGGPARATAAPSLPAPAPAAPPPGISATIAPETFDIYRLLPFGKKDFVDGATAAQQFAALYATFRFDEEPQTYLARLRPLVIDQVYADLGQGAGTPGILEDRRTKQTVAVGRAKLDSIRTIGDSSVIFLVTATQDITEQSGPSTKSQQYAVTVQRDGNSWKVFAFSRADEGQAGDEP